jgi:peptidoglycan-associated lipoprotein
MEGKEVREMRRSTLWLVAALMLVAVPWLTTSCAKKAVQGEEGVAAPTETRPGDRPGTGMVGARPTEETLSAEERRRREAEAAFTNEDIQFDFDKYDLNARAREILANKAYFLKQYPNVKILIEGHCDERGTAEYNLALGERRANSAKQYLVQLGISENRISTVSYGKERPLDPGHNEAAWAKNRRAHFVIVSR